MADLGTKVEGEWNKVMPEFFKKLVTSYGRRCENCSEYRTNCSEYCVDLKLLLFLGICLRSSF